MIYVGFMGSIETYAFDLNNTIDPCMYMHHGFGAFMRASQYVC